MTTAVKHKRAVPDRSTRHARRPRAAQGETGPPEDRFDDAVPGSLFQDRESPPESAQVEGAIDDWPGVDGTPDDVPAEPNEPSRRR
jgi:hypothetical protein